MTEAPTKPKRRERRMVSRKASRSWNSAIEPIKPIGMMPAARAANTAVCFGIVRASASGRMPAEVAKSSAPRLRAPGLGIEGDRVGTAPRRALDKAALRHRHEQHRAPHRQVFGHLLRPIVASP